jgi:hypothetical protein
MIKRFFRYSCEFIIHRHPSIFNFTVK